MTKCKSDWLSCVNKNLCEDDTTAHFFGEYLLEEGVWMEAGMYMSSIVVVCSDMMEDDEISGVVDDFIWRMTK